MKWLVSIALLTFALLVFIVNAASVHGSAWQTANLTATGTASPMEGCSREDVAVYQGATAPLPNGIPTYTVEVLNVCVRGCAVGEVHVACGWFSSARLINPRVFRRLRYDDCLVNNGAPIPAGESLTFQYANSYPYPLYVSSIACYCS